MKSVPAVAYIYELVAIFKMAVHKTINCLVDQIQKFPFDKLNQQNWINETAPYLTLFIGRNHEQNKS